MPLRPDMEPKEYLDILRRRKWLIIFSFLVVLFGAFVYSVTAPELYKSSTMILVVPQRVPEGYVRSTVSVRIEERLATIQQQVMSRTRLTAVMHELGLFKAEREKLPIELVVENMRKRIQIQVTSSNRGGQGAGGDAFSLTFIHENPQLAMLTTSRLASFFIEENLRSREQQAVGTSEFLESQLQETKAKLEAQEEKLKRYKLQFMGELPQQLQANLQNLARLQDTLRANSDAIRSAHDRKTLLESQVQSLEAQIGAIVAQQAAAGRAGGGEGAVEVLVDPSDPAAPLVVELNAKKSQLAALSAKYTEQYPETRRLKEEVSQLEKRIAEMQRTDPATAVGGGSPPAHRSAMGGTPVTTNAPGFREREEIRRLQTQITAVDLEISSLKAEQQQIKAHITELNARVEKSPRREQEMVSLTRDYDNLRAQYDDMLRKKLDADVSQNLEKRQKGEQFQMLDPANLPQEPFTPNRPKIFGMALMVAFALGFGSTIGLEMFNPTLRGTKDFKHFFDLNVLGSIPEIHDELYERRIRFRRAAIMGGLVSFTAAVTVFLVMYGGKVRSIVQSVAW